MGAMPDNTSLSKTELDASTDSPVNARAQIETMYDKLLAVINAYADANGLCDLDATTKIPAARLPFTTVLHTKVLDIGGWNMFTTGSAFVAHGLDHTKIRNISAIIRNDFDSNYFHFPVPRSVATSTEMMYATATNIVMLRASGGQFEDTDFDTMGDDGNRGWITIQYTD